MKPKPDIIDDLLAAWEGARPDLDASPLGLVGRVLVLARRLERRVDAALAKHEITLGQFDILATLRRATDQSPGLTPKQLLKSVMLTSGGMTNRLDKLEAAGLIARKPDPSDRRGVIVALTAKGRKVIDAATATRFAEAEHSLPNISARDRAKMEALLRNWLNAVEPAEGR
jgi:DNA-binding MarR family transcriptional regulator